MKLSIITISLDSARTIGDALRSVSSQTHPDIEHIVVDGGSTDGTMEIVASFGTKIAKSVSEPDNGIYDALNKGLKMATGEVVGFLHADDLYAADDVLAKVAVAFQDEKLDSVYGDLQYVYRKDTGRVFRHWSSGRFSPRRLRFGWMPPHPAFFVRRSVYEALGAFDTRYRIAADYDLVLRFLGRHRISTRYLPFVMVKMRTGGASNRSLPGILRKSFEDYLALRRNRSGGALALACKNLRKLGQLLPR